MMLEMVRDRVATGVTSGLNGCCTAMWKTSGKTTTLLLLIPRVVTGEKNSPTAAHAGRKRRPKWVPSAWGYSWAPLPRGL
jgi:hypothetical protein